MNNDFLDNVGPIISIDANSMKSDVVADWGRSTGWVSSFDAYDSNHGPLVRENRLTDNQINGMEVRGATLTCESIWDDTDIVHVLRSEIVVPNYHHEGGLRLQSSADESLVIKLLGDTAGFTASGRPLEIDDRIGGTFQVIGMPGKPVVFTSLRDDDVSAGFTILGEPQFDTNGDGPSEGQPGDWRSIKLDKYSNDRNVAVINEKEAPSQSAQDENGSAFTAQSLGALAESEAGGDDNLRLGFEVHGVIRTDAPDDVDVYTFDATAGTEIWIDIDWTVHALDSIIELIDADGKVLARSDNSMDEELAGAALGDNVFTMDKDYWLRHDFYTTNQRDAGMRLVLPGDTGQTRTYYVRVRSALSIGNVLPGDQIQDGEIFTISDAYQTVTFEFDKNGSLSNSQNVPVTIDDTFSPTGVAAAIRDAVKLAALPYGSQPYARGLAADARVQDGNVVLDGAHVRFDERTTQLDHLANTSGTYQFQVRLREMQEIPGSLVYLGDIRYAENGIEVLGFPQHSPILGETSEVEGQGQTGQNDQSGSAQTIGNLLSNDQNTLSVAGYLSNYRDVDWYRMTIDYTGIQSIGGINDAGSMYATIFDIDYADDMGRPNLTLWVFDSSGQLLFMGDGSNVAEDRPDPIAGASVEQLSRGSLGASDPFIGSAILTEGNGSRGTYLIAVTSSSASADVVGVNYPLTRLEPVNSVWRVAEEHFDGSMTPGPGGGPLGQPITVTANELTLGDVIMYVNTRRELYTVDAFSGDRETDVTGPNRGIDEQNRSYDDIMMRDDGWLFTMAGAIPRPATSMLPSATTGSSARATARSSRILMRVLLPISSTAPGDALEVYEPGMRFHAMNYQANGSDYFLAVGSMDGGNGVQYTTNLLYMFDEDGTFEPETPNGNRLTTNAIPRGQLVSGSLIDVVPATQASPPYSDNLGVPITTGVPMTVRTTTFTTV